MTHYKLLVLSILIVSPFLLFAQKNEAADSLLQEGLALAGEGKLTEGNALLFKGLDELPTKPDAKTEYLLKVNIGFNYTLLNDFDNAIDYILQSLNVEGLQFDSALTTVKTKGYYYLGSISRLKGEFRDALTYFDSTLVLSKAIFGEDHIRVGDVHNVMGLSYKYLGRYKEALASYDRAYAIFSNAGNAVRQAMITHNVGDIHKERGFFDKAAENMESALGHYIAGRGPDHIDIATIYVNLADLEFSRGNYEETLNYGTKAMTILGKTEEHRARNLASLFTMFAQVYQQRGQIEEAVSYFEQAASEYRKLSQDEVFGLVSVYNSKAEMFLDLGMPEKALEDIQQAKTLADRYQQSDVTIYSGATLKLRAMAHAALKDYELADRYYNNAVASFQKLGIDKHPQLVDIYLEWGRRYEDEGKNDEALQYYNLALRAGVRAMEDSGDDVLVADIINPLSTLEVLSAKANLLQKLAKLDQDNPYLKESLKTLQLANKVINDARLAYRSYKDKQLLATLAADIYGTAVGVCYDLYLASGDVATVDIAFQFSERNKTFILQESSSNKNALRVSSLPDEIVEMESQLRLEQSQLRQEYEAALFNANDRDALLEIRNRQIAAKSSYDSLLLSIEQQYPTYHQLKYSTRSLTIPEVQSALLNEDEILIEYLLTDRKLFVIAIEKSGAEMHAVSISEDFQSSVRDFRESVVTRNKSKYQSVAHELYNILLKPLGQLQAKKIYIVQDGVIGYVPFEILLSEDRDLPYNQLSYLIKKHQFSYLYSAGLGVKKKQPLLNRSPFLGIAPTFTGEATARSVASRGVADLPPLPGAISEVRAATKILQGEALINERATERNFRNEAGRFGILHFATHAVVDNDNPELSRLFFSSAGDSINDGSLHVYELYNMNLNADLVTLSACDTGFGSVMNGEGVMSLGRAFAYAGSMNILMSLWLASDKSTPLIMESFYKELVAGKPKDEALHNAKLQYLDQAGAAAADPFLWGGFVFTGDTAALDYSEDRTTWWASWTVFFVLIAVGLIWRRRVSRSS